MPSNRIGKIPIIVTSLFIGSLVLLTASASIVLVYLFIFNPSPDSTKVSEQITDTSTSIPYPPHTVTTEVVSSSAYPIETTLEPNVTAPSVYPGLEETNPPSFPAPGSTESDFQFPTATQFGSNSYIPVGTLPTSTATPGSSGAYPGPGTPAFNTPVPTFTFPAINTGIPPTAFPIPAPTQNPSQTPIPLPAWVIADLQPSPPAGVKLISGKYQLIMFFAFWDGASLAMAPLVHSIEEIYQDRMNFIYLDIDNPATRKLKEDLGYKLQPHFFLVDPQGIILQQWIGYVKYNELVSSIESVLD